MKRFLTLLFIMGLFSVQVTLAVTPKEMDQARAIAAHAYLRYANDGSGYLDQVKPSSMEDLEKVLKTKEKANLKEFKAIPVPTNYASWTKEQLVDYWSTKAFSTPSLSEKGKAGKTRARKNLNAMKVAAPGASAQTEKASQPEKPATPAQKAVPTEKETPATASASQKPTTSENLPTESVDSLTLQAEQQLAEAEQLAAAELDEEPIEKASNHTWVYIVILCILVGVVVALVVFASNVVKKNQMRRPQEEAIPVISGNADMNAIRDKFAASLNAKNIEIQNLNKKLESLAGENENLKFKLERANSELGMLRKRVEDNSMAAKPQTTPAVAPAASADGARKKNVRTIFLGHVNNNGLFVRADRTIIPDATVFRLDTTDGYSGSFRVVNDPEIWKNCLRNPIEKLSRGCTADNLSNPGNMQRVITEASGTAVLEDGHWKVLRKAKVRFE